MKIKYYKDLNHNYLIFGTQIKEEKRDYQHRMITGNRIKNLLPCKIRYINEECHFYYEISSRQSLRNIFDIKELGLEQIYHLFESLKAVQGEMENFLLDSRCLVLCPDYIYTEPEREEYFFVYYPYYKEEIEKEEVESNMTEMSLPEFLIDKVGKDDRETVDIVYKIYERMQDDKFILSEVIKILETQWENSTIDVKGNADVIHTKSIEEESQVRPHDFSMGIDEGIGNREYCDNANQDIASCLAYDSNNEKGGIQARSIAAVGILSFLCMAAAAAIWGIGYFYTLSTEEKIISVAGIIILIILSALFLVYFLFNYKKQKTVKEEYTDEEQFYNKNPYETREAFVSREAFTSKETLTSKEALAVRDRFTESQNFLYPKKEETKGQWRQGGDAEPEDYGKTVFLETSMIKTEHKLYGTNKGNKYQIDLNNLPCIIGKLAGSVDIVIKDKTISRIHAKLLRQEEEIFVTDLNSTNGTFKNGLRIEPNERVLIEPGDELRFGAMTFSYR